MFKAINFKSEWFHAGIKKIIKVPTKGNTRIKINKFVTFKKKRLHNANKQ